MENAALGGSLSNLTFTFKHFGIESAICQIEGEQSFHKRFDVDVDGGQIMLAYRAGLFNKFGSKYAQSDMTGVSFFWHLSCRMTLTLGYFIPLPLVRYSSFSSLKRPQPLRAPCFCFPKRNTYFRFVADFKTNISKHLTLNF